jgi:hypothetical protein
MGREMGSLNNGHWEKGRHTFTLQAGELPNGIYIIRLTMIRASGGSGCELPNASCKLLVH